jgi:hypothetical protein
VCYKKISSLSIGHNFDIYSLDSTITASSWSGKIISDTTGVLLTLELGNIPSEITNIELTDDIGTKFELEHDLLNGAGLGNRLWITDIGDNMYNVNFSLDSTINIQHYKFQLDVNIISIQKILYEPINDFTSQQNYDLDSQHCEDPVWSGGKAGVFEPAGGLDPNIMTYFDTPGEVEVVYSAGNAIYAGLKTSNGCIIINLDEDGTIINSQQFAVGYTIKGIHQDGGLLALAAGNDGILLYNWNGGTDVSFIGKIETAYANNVKVAGDIIFAATEDGIEIIQIDH